MITGMSNPKLPQEILDYILDFLHDEPQALKNCCLVAKSRVSRARKHLFGDVQIASLTGLEAWRKVFPDPGSSPAYYTHSLRFRFLGLVSSIVAGGCSFVRPFSNVVRLELWSGKSILHVRFLQQLLTGSTPEAYEIPGLTSSQFFEFICSLPLLEDLHVVVYEIRRDANDGPVFQPPSSPPLTGTLSLSLVEGIEYVTSGLLSLPNGVHFRKFLCTWRLQEDFRWVIALVEGFSDTLEYVEIDRSGPFPLLLR